DYSILFFSYWCNSFHFLNVSCIIQRKYIFSSIHFKLAEFSLLSSFIPSQPNISGDNLVAMIQLQDPSIDIHKEGKYLLHSVQELVSGDQCEGRFVFGRESKKPRVLSDTERFAKDGSNPKSLLQPLLMRAG
ncbi:hypothetical protein C5H24_12775, partial [Xylella fastidiosa]